jgi:hypothetical protein
MVEDGVFTSGVHYKWFAFQLNLLEKDFVHVDRIENRMAAEYSPCISKDQLLKSFRMFSSADLFVTLPNGSRVKQIVRPTLDVHGQKCYVNVQPSVNDATRETQLARVLLVGQYPGVGEGEQVDVAFVRWFKGSAARPRGACPAGMTGAIFRQLAPLGRAGLDCIPLSTVQSLAWCEPNFGRPQSDDDKDDYYYQIVPGIIA